MTINADSASRGWLRGVVTLLATLLLAACEKAPSCQFAGQPDSAPSAGCLVVHDGAVLLMETMAGKFAPPGGSISTGESAQCAAERETYEETGVSVRALELAAQFDNGFHLYWCEALGEPSPEVKRPLEVKSVGFYAPNEFYDLVWRFPDQARLVINMIEQGAAP